MRAPAFYMLLAFLLTLGCGSDVDVKSVNQTLTAHVRVPESIPGARLLGREATLPHATATIYNAHGTSIGTTIVQADGSMTFDGLAPGIYRLVLTNGTPGVVLQGVASPGEDSPIDTTTTAVTLIALAATEGNLTEFNFESIDRAIRSASDPDAVALLNRTEDCLKGRSAWISPDGRKPLDPEITALVSAINKQSLKSGPWTTPSST